MSLLPASSNEAPAIPGQDWIMCNSCCRPAAAAASVAISFYVTKCGHIFCSKCLIAFASQRVQKDSAMCLFCNKEIKICKICNDMPGSIKVYFRSPSELLTETINEIMRIIKFQTMHAIRLCKRFYTMQTNYENLRRYCYEILHKNAALERQLLNKTENSSDSNHPIDDTTAPAVPRTSATTATNLHTTLSEESPKTTTTTVNESVSKSGTESSVVANSTCSLNESVVINMARISVEKPDAPGISGTHPGSLNDLRGPTNDTKNSTKNQSAGIFAKPLKCAGIVKRNHSVTSFRKACQTSPRKRQFSHRLDIPKGCETIAVKKSNPEL